MNKLQMLETQLKEITKALVTASADELLTLLEYQTDIERRIESEKKFLLAA